MPAAVPTGAAFDLVLLAHVAAVVVALGSVVVCGVQAARVLAAREGSPPAGVVSYFSPGVNWVGRTLYAVPVLGVALLAMSGGAFGYRDGWVQWGIGLWVVAALCAEGLLWPSERRVQAGLAAGVGAGAGDATLRRHCRAACLWSGVLAVLLLVAIVLMVAQP